jgi:hypothetical protein
MKSLRFAILFFVVTCVPLTSISAEDLLSNTIATPTDLAAAFAREVELRLVPPPDEAIRYGLMLSESLQRTQVVVGDSQIVVLVDRSPKLQALLLFYVDANLSTELIGAALVSTGRVGEFDHFETPIGVFAHTIDNLAFRAEGTKNELGIRGYGARGMRIFDFGWQQARKGWGDRSVATMRLQMHATDPTLLEQKLGTVQSKGCIRISASLNRFIDRYGLLDADYETAMQRGKTFWVLDPNRTPTPWSGRYLVVVDTERTTRPAWSYPTPSALQAKRLMKREKEISIATAKKVGDAEGCSKK